MPEGMEIQPGEHTGRIYHTHAMQIGGTIYVKIPPENHDHLALTQLKDEDTPNRVPLQLMEQSGDYGKYFSLWNPDQQQSEE